MPIALSQTNPSCSSECFDASSSNLNINPSDDSEVRETFWAVATTVICINPDASAEEPCCSTNSPQFNPTYAKSWSEKRNPNRKEKKMFVTTTP